MKSTLWIAGSRIVLVLAAFLWCLSPRGLLAQFPPASSEPDIVERDPRAAAEREALLLSGTRQLTFEGRRAGEGYFSADGRRMIFQSEREPDNPFFQIYVMDFDTGDIQRVSPGYGKTTCAWIHPDGQHVLFASTHEDPQARDRQREEFELRESGRQRRYSWDYDKHYEIYRHRLGTDQFENLTRTLGYDAEGSWSPDGQLIAFASNRRAYTDEMTEAERETFELNPSSMIDIYLMDADGGQARRLTDSPGYDGGPFFSPDGQRICWRRFSTDGSIAEIWTMGLDGEEARQLTRMGVMSWAPFYHPSGEYLIFTTNLHGFANFELYLVDVDARSMPVRVTYSAGFDGLPAFTPDGNQLVWTSNRTASNHSQLFLADWNHEQARQVLGLTAAATTASSDTAQAVEAAASASRQTTAQFSPADLMRHVDYLCRPELEGRLTGTRGEQLATAYVAAYLDYLGLEPAGDDGTFFQTFPFTSGVSLGEHNHLAWGERQYEIEQDWIPVSFSRTGDVPAAPIVFAGYGITAPAEDPLPAYDSFVHLDVRDKWVLALRFIPEDVSPERRQHLSRYSSLRYKAMVARDKGARGLILVNGPNSQTRHPLIPLTLDGSLAGTGVPVISVTDQVAEQWLATADKSLRELQDQLDQGEPMMGFPLDDVELSARIDVEQVTRSGRNVLARLPAGDRPTDQMIVIGAHVDHLGTGPSSSSLAGEDEREQIHFGADDNASGVAAMLEIAAYLSRLKAAGQWTPERDALFAAWSGEELGLIGSSHFVNQFPVDDNSEQPETDDPNAESDARTGSLYPRIAACLNLDMVGRLDERLILQGLGSSSVWPSVIERANVPVGLPITMQEESYLPTDASSFYMRGVPILSAFTGSHGEYHTPRDTPETLNYEGLARIARLMALVTRSLATADQPPDYVARSRPAERGQRAAMRAYLGTIPDYAQAEVQGVRLSGVGSGGPAEKAGLRAGDVIVELAGQKVENIYDYTFALQALKIGEPVQVVVERDSQRITLEVVPGSRD